MRKQDKILLVSTFSSMVLGVCMPFLAEPLAWFPRVSMLTMLFISFLAIDGKEALLHVLHSPFVVFLLLLLSLVVMPFVCWGVFYFVLPEYALGAALIGGTSAAVMAPFFAFMVQADVILVIVGMVSTSLLMPLTLPLLLAFIGNLAQVGGGIQIDLSVGSMITNLSVMMVIPFVAAQIVRRVWHSVTVVVFKVRQVIFLLTTCVTMVAIFAQYSSIILQSPESVLWAILSTVLVELLIFLFSAAVTFWLPPATQLAIVICCLVINSVIVLILAVDFFGAPEALVAAMFSAGVFAALPLLRILCKLRGYNPTESNVR